MAAGDINLLKTKSTLSQEQVAILDHLKTVGYVLITLAIFGGMATGSVYFLLANQLSSAENRKSELLRQVTTHASKEALYVSLKDRLPIVQKVLDNKENWAGILEIIPSIAFTPSLKSVIIGENNITQLTIQTDTIEDTATVVNQVISLVGDRRIYNPQLVGLQITEHGSVQMTLSFLPLF